jgi:hypothetical protein
MRQGDAGHARYRYGDACKLLAEQQPHNERGTIGNAAPVATSLKAARISTLFIANT